MTRASCGGHARDRRREPADKHFGRLQATRYRRDALGTTPLRFEVYRADQVRTSSTLFSGGDWHWRLCDPDGEVLVDAGGYLDELTCQTAVGILQRRAALATFGPIARDPA